MSNVKEIAEVLNTEGVFISTTSGTSMYPMLRDRKDVIVVKKNEERLKKYDIDVAQQDTENSDVVILTERSDEGSRAGTLPGH